METLQQAKEYLRANWEKGIDCPCCNQFVKRYKRPMHSAMVVSLIKLYKLPQSNIKYHHINEFVSLSAGDFSKLRYWGFVEEKKKESDDTSKRTSGYWRITEKGIDFVENKITVQSHILLFNAKYYGHDGKEIGIKDVLKNKFNYNELMNHYFSSTN